MRTPDALPPLAPKPRRADHSDLGYFVALGIYLGVVLVLLGALIAHYVSKGIL